MELINLDHHTTKAVFSYPEHGYDEHGKPIGRFIENEVTYDNNDFIASICRLYLKAENDHAKKVLMNILLKLTEKWKHD